MTPEWLYTRLGKVLIDALTLTAALLIAYTVRFDGHPPPAYLRQAFSLGPYVVVTTIAILGAHGVYGLVWRYTNLRDMTVVVTGLVVQATLWSILRILVPDPFGALRLPFGVISIYFSVSVIGLTAVRVARRDVYERSRHRAQRPSGALRRVLLVGAGDSGILLARELAQRADLRVVGFVDDDRRKWKTTIDGVRVRGGTAEIPRVVIKQDVDEVVITFSSAPPRKIREIIDICEEIPVRVRIVPGLYERLDHHTPTGQLREVRIEDLLARDVVRLDLSTPELVETYRNKRILVTGAGGSIGSELCRQLLSLTPEALLLVDQDESNTYDTHTDLLHLGAARERIQHFILDIRDEAALRRVFATCRPQVVLHAAAFKHVPLLEEHVVEAVDNNVLATAHLVDFAVKHPVDTFVLISTDKAVNPTSVMGATKRIAEMVVQAAAQRHGLRSSCVRFGNVLESRGSVVPIFKRQIARGGPVTLTHPDATRYFMTIAEAAQLVLQAGSLARNGEIFLLDMGKPVRIIELARDLIHLSGLREPEDIQIEIVGLRPGERLHEELAELDTTLSRTKFEKILVVSGGPPVRPHMVGQLLDSLTVGVKCRDKDRLLGMLLNRNTPSEHATLDQSAPGSLTALR